MSKIFLSELGYYLVTNVTSITRCLEASHHLGAAACISFMRQHTKNTFSIADEHILNKSTNIGPDYTSFGSKKRIVTMDRSFGLHHR